MVERPASGAKAGSRPVHAVRQREYSKDRDRESHRPDVETLAKARPDHSALAIRAWGDQGNVSLAERVAASPAVQHR